jgi:O-acetyl-ADP-ribose deacetylase (regulator of RNase III)
MGRAAMISYVSGDATYPELQRPDGVKLIVHVCNDVGAWGAGFVMAVSKRFPMARSSYRTAIRRGAKLGSVHFVDPHYMDIMVGNMIAQHGIGRGQRRIRYGALRKCLTKVAEFARHYTTVSIHMPRIGCGLGGGTWGEVGPIVEEALGAFDVLVYGKVDDGRGT